MLERVQKILARSGVSSRRDCEEIIAQGRVSVNGKMIGLGDKADADRDVIKVDGERVKPKKPIYIIFNKPKGCVCAVSDNRYRTVLDYVRMDVFPVGRLDRNTTGLLLLTNDGNFADKVIHPRHGTDKTYIATLDREFRAESQLMRGTRFGQILVFPKSVKILSRRRVQITIHSGIKHVVKEMFIRLGYDVVDLERTQLGRLTLHGLNPGRYRKLTPEEVASFDV